VPNQALLLHVLVDALYLTYYVPVILSGDEGQSAPASQHAQKQSNKSAPSNQNDSGSQAALS